MNKIPITQLYKTQISLTEWFEKINHPKVEELRIEDNQKRPRMGIVNDIIGLPYDKPTVFSATEVKNRSKKFTEYLNNNRDNLCAMRLVPTEANLPKLRMRGHTVNNALNDWFPNQNIDHGKYKVEFIPHPTIHYWSTIFIVNQFGIQGEIIKDSHQHLTQGFYEEQTPITFNFDFNKWQTSPNNEEAITHLKKVAELIQVENPQHRDKLSDKLKSKFFNNYLAGYFETVCSDLGTWFIDYNRILGDIYSNLKISNQTTGELAGQIGCQGLTTGKAKIVCNPATDNIQTDEILVCDMTSPNFVPLMKKSAGIITDRGGILSHAAIVARELNKPCLVGTKNATKILKDGQLIELDANKGMIIINI